MTAKELAVLAAKALDSKKGEDIKIMEVTEQTTLAEGNRQRVGQEDPQCLALALVRHNLPASHT